MKLKVRQLRSTATADERQSATVRGLGLRRPGDERVLANTPAIRGMIRKVLHLVSVDEIDA